MNWLAHVFLSLPNGSHRLGNLLGDLVKGKERARLNPCFNAGIQCHLLIDSFTDSHPIIRQSKRKISSEHRRYSGVLIDIFYDHFLAINWQDYSSITLSGFTQEVYASFENLCPQIPLFPRMVVYRMIEQDWLGSYEHISGIEMTLKRIKAKLSVKHEHIFLIDCFLQELENNYDELNRDFQKFFPKIIDYIFFENLIGKFNQIG